MSEYLLRAMTKLHNLLAHHSVGTYIPRRSAYTLPTYGCCAVPLNARERGLTTTEVVHGVGGIVRHVGGAHLPEDP